MKLDVSSRGPDVIVVTTTTGRVRAKRWNDERERADGYRLLICRYRPRGVRKEDETWNAWWPELGPSRELHAAFWGKHAKAIPWSEYKRRYLREMKARVDRIAELSRRVKDGETITLLCSSACTDPERCHRTLLANLVRAGAGD